MTGRLVVGACSALLVWRALGIPPDLLTWNRSRIWRYLVLVWQVFQLLRVLLVLLAVEIFRGRR